ELFVARDPLVSVRVVQAHAEKADHLPSRLLPLGGHLPGSRQDERGKIGSAHYKAARRGRSTAKAAIFSPLPLYSGGEGPGVRGLSQADPLTPNPSPTKRGRGEEERGRLRFWPAPRRPCRTPCRCAVPGCRGSAR